MKISIGSFKVIEWIRLHNFETNNFKGALFCKKNRSRSYGSYSLTSSNAA